jgi:hypothetical protein
LWLVKRVLPLQLSAIVLKGMGPQPVERNALEKSRWNDAIGVDVVADQGNAATRNCLNLTHGVHLN